jgi:hypothetical protein
MMCVRYSMLSLFISLSSSFFLSLARELALNHRQQPGSDRFITDIFSVSLSVALYALHSLSRAVESMLL